MNFGTTIRSLLSIAFLVFSSIAIGQVKLPLDPDKSITKFIIDQWNEEKGLPTQTLNTIFQASDGYLWIGSYNGLFRFDGRKFDVFGKQNIPGLKTNSFSAIVETKEGKMYVGTAGSGIFVYENEQFRQLGNADELLFPVESILPEQNGDVWIGTREKGLLFYSKSNNRFSVVEDYPPLKDVTINKLIRDNDGNTWAGTEGNGLVRFNGDIYTQFSEKNGLVSNQISAMYLDSKEQIWIGSTNGVNTWKQGVLNTMHQLNRIPVMSFVEDRAGNMWIGTNEGLFRRNAYNNEFEYTSETTGFPNNSIMDITQGREGSLWIATYRAGLIRLRDGLFTNFTTQDGIGSKAISSVCDYRKGQYLISTENGEVYRINGNQVAPFLFKAPLSSARIKHVFEDSRQNVWISSYSGLLRIDRYGNERLYTASDGFLDSRFRMVYEDVHGNIWCGTRSGGVVKFDPNYNTTLYNKENGLASNFIMCIEGDAEGNIYIGTNDFGIDIIQTDGNIVHYDDSNGLPSRLVFNMLIEDGKDEIWITTNAGLSRLKGGKIETITTDEGFLSDVAFDILDSNGYFWFSSSLGVFRIEKEEMRTFMNGALPEVTSELFGRKDGMAEKECTGATQSLSSQTGKLLFPTLGGLAVLDPENLSKNSLKPPVDIQQFVVNGQQVDLSSNKLILPAGSQRFVFRFAGLTYLSPDKVRFKYKLSGVDEGWVDGGNERQAVYTEIWPGEYTFQVIAANADGIWNTEGESLKFELEPHFYQTYWFFGLCVLAVVLGGYTFYQWRISQIKKQKVELEKLVQIRTAEISQQKEEIESQRDKLSEQREKLELAYNDIKVVGEIGQEVTATLHVDDLSQIVYINIQSLMSADFFAIGLYEPKLGKIEYRRPMAEGKERPKFVESMEEDYRLSVRCVLEQKPILVNSVASQHEGHSKFKEKDTSEYGTKVNSLMFVPLALEGETVGLMTVQSFQEDAYVDQHLTILQALASYISVALQNAQNFEVIEDKNNQITDSIRYAKTIQHAFLPSINEMRLAFRDFALIYRPKDIVSGDFYWFARHKDGSYHLAVADCTGHGVPGGFMSMIGTTFLNEIINMSQVHSPAEALEMLNVKVRRALGQQEGKNDDGMDISLIQVQEAGSKKKITYAGAKRSLWYYDGSMLLEEKGTNKAIGGLRDKTNKKFANKELLLNPGSTLYLFTDGYPDQADLQRNKFGTKKLIALLEDHKDKELSMQKVELIRALDQHQKEASQRDDITFLAVRI